MSSNFRNVLEIPEQCLVNLGCGRTFHPDWINLDLQPSAPEVQAHDILSGLPFPDNTLDAVYHSHVLEHLTQDQGERMLRDCWRALKPGGVLRIVVPDLEQIARLYLDNHAQAWQGEASAKSRYEWMKLELLDQMVRCQSGGRMGRYMAEIKEEEADFVRTRLGHEFLNCRRSEASRLIAVPSTERPSAASRSWRERWASWWVGKLLGKTANAAFLESLFRSRGEVHRWMYDRFSLRELCQTIGFADFQIVTARQSYLPDFERYQLDTCGSEIRKPDSLFCECRKPGAAQTSQLGLSGAA